MADRASDLALVKIQKSWPLNNISKKDLLDIARCHQKCLWWTASSCAGLDILQSLYEVLVRDSLSQVLWVKGTRRFPHLGGFAAGTVDFRQTEKRIGGALPKKALFRLAARTLLQPGHLLAQRCFGSRLPKGQIGYVLTIGVTEQAKKSNSAVRGTLLLHELEKWFMQMDASVCFVDTELTNTRAVGFYRSRGYKEVSRRFGQILLSHQLK